MQLINCDTCNNKDVCKLYEPIMTVMGKLMFSVKETIFVYCKNYISDEMTIRPRTSEERGE